VAEDRDPLPAILDVQAQLQAAGIDLLFVPVPAKAVIYAHEMGEGEVPEGRLDPSHQDFYALLEREGVKTLDLVPVFQQALGESSIPLYCRQDTHWSGRGCQLAAQAIARAVGPAPWRKPSSLQLKPGRVQIQGDLWQELPEPRPPREEVEVTYVGRTGSGVLEPLPWDRESPVLLLGDSHNLVFSAGGDLFALGAGLPDHLAHELGVALDVVAVRGSGATPARVNLLRRGDSLASKKLVIWCLSVREFTEGAGWKKLPVKRPG
jgi:alginate O-acetyltransferase complex protein AlgJ